jgi:hypothetical protein
MWHCHRQFENQLWLARKCETLRGSSRERTMKLLGWHWNNDVMKLMERYRMRTLACKLIQRSTWNNSSNAQHLPYIICLRDAQRRCSVAPAKLHGCQSPDLTTSKLAQAVRPVTYIGTYLVRIFSRIPNILTEEFLSSQTIASNWTSAAPLHIIFISLFIHHPFYSVICNLRYLHRCYEHM